MKKLVVELLSADASLRECFIDHVRPEIVLDHGEPPSLSGVVLAADSPITAVQLRDRAGNATPCTAITGMPSPVIGDRYRDIPHAGTSRFSLTGLKLDASNDPFTLEVVVGSKAPRPVARLYLADVTGVLTAEDRVPTKRSALRFLRDNGLSVGTVLDIGVQHRTKDLMDAFPDKKHLLFEPVEENYPIIARNYASFDYELVRAAVSSRDGEGTLEVLTRTAGSPFLTSTVVAEGVVSTSPGMLKTAVRKTPTITLDGFLSAASYQRPYLIKLDVDGNELDILSGARQTLKQTSCVIVEVALSNMLERGKFLVDEGFVLWDIVDLGYYRNNLFHADLIFLSTEEKARPAFSPWRALPFDERKIVKFLH